MRKLGVLLVVALLALVGGWLALQRPQSQSNSTAKAHPSTRVEVRSANGGADASRSSVASAAKSIARSDKRRAEREELRKRILDAIHARERERERERERDAAESAVPREDEDSTTTDDALAPTPGGLSDRTGTHEYLVKVMNEDLMPLADECYALTLVNQPELAGLLVLDFEIVADEEIGGIVESVTFGQNNEVVDPDLFECMRESILATTLPAPEQSGRDAISISMPLSPEDAD